jgi:hypothetical protein
MQTLLIGSVLWLVLDVALLSAWVALGNARTRRQARAMLAAAGHHANVADPLAAALNSGHAQDPEVRHARRRAQAVQAKFGPL